MSYPYPVTSSGSKTTSVQITTRTSLLGGMDMISPATGTATLVIYDSNNSTTAGKLILAEFEIDAGMPSCNHEYTNFVTANNGLYAQLTDGSGTASFIVRFAVIG